MDPISFGVVFTGATGGALVGIALLEKAGFKINETALKIGVEVVKLVVIYKLIKYAAFLFLF